MPQIVSRETQTNPKGENAMRKEKRHLTLDADVIDGLQPYLDKIGLSLSAYVRFALAQSYAQLTGLSKVVDFEKPIGEISIGDMVKISKALTTAGLESDKIDLSDAMTADELEAYRARK